MDPCALCKPPMQINVPDALAARLAMLTQEEARRAFALGLFVEEFLTLAQAARLADLDRLAFQRLLASHEIPVHYGIEEFEQDLATIQDRLGGSGQSDDKPWLALRGSARFVGDPVAPIDPGTKVGTPPEEEKDTLS